MKIEFTGFKNTPGWETLQTAIREATGDENALLTRISRTDRNCNYRAPGTYKLGAIIETVPNYTEFVELELVVTR